MFFQIVFHNPAVLVTNDHTNSFNYKGYMRIKTNVVVARHIYTDGWIRYYIPGGRDTGRVYTKKTGTELREARVTFWDSLNPIAKKTRFRYDCDTQYVGGNTPRKMELKK